MIPGVAVRLAGFDPESSYVNATLEAKKIVAFRCYEGYPVKGSCLGFLLDSVCIASCYSDLTVLAARTIQQVRFGKRWKKVKNGSVSATGLVAQRTVDLDFRGLRGGCGWNRVNPTLPWLVSFISNKWLT